MRAASRVSLSFLRGARGNYGQAGYCPTNTPAISGVMGPLTALDNTGR